MDGLNCLKAREATRGVSLLFTTKFPKIPGTRSQKFLILTVSGVSSLNNPTVVQLDKMPQYQPIKCFEYIGKYTEKIIP